MENCTPSIRGVLQRERFRVRMEASGLSKDLGFCGLGCGLQDLRYLGFGIQAFGCRGYKELDLGVCSGQYMGSKFIHG